MKKGIVVLGCMLTGLLYAAEPAHAFTLPTVEASKNEVVMPMGKKDLVLLNMWASWCPGCKEEMPLLDELARKYKGLHVIAVNVDNKRENAQKYLKHFSEQIGKKSKITFLYDAKKSVVKAYKVRAFPTSVLIKGGKVIKSYLGSFNASNYDALLKDIDKAR